MTASESVIALTGEMSRSIVRATVKMSMSQTHEAPFGLAARYEDFVRNRKTREKVLAYCGIENPPLECFMSDSKVNWQVCDALNPMLRERLYLWACLRRKMQIYGYTWK